MLFPLDLTPAAGTALSAVISAGIALRAVGDALDTLALDTAAAADAADWQAPSAGRFHERADDLRVRLDGLRVSAEDAVRDAIALRTQLVVSAPSGLVP